MLLRRVEEPTDDQPGPSRPQSDRRSSSHSHATQRRQNTPGPSLSRMERPLEAESLLRSSRNRADGNDEIGAQKLAALNEGQTVPSAPRLCPDIHAPSAPPLHEEVFCLHISDILLVSFNQRLQVGLSVVLGHLFRSCAIFEDQRILNHIESI